MAKKNSQEILDNFIHEFTEALRAEVLAETTEELIRRVQETGDVSFGSKPMARKKTKGRRISRPCPIEGCKGVAAPRHQMVCKEHVESLSREEILLARDQAEKPGGIWHKWRQKKQRQAS